MSSSQDTTSGSIGMTINASPEKSCTCLPKCSKTTDEIRGPDGLQSQETVMLIPGSTIRGTAFSPLDDVTARIASCTVIDEDSAHVQPGAVSNDGNSSQTCNIPGHSDRATISSYPPALALPRHSWGHTSASSFRVRSRHYKRAKKKEPSLEAFYKLVSFDLIKASVGCVNHVGRLMDLEKVRPARSFPGLPPLFIVNTQLPDGEPAMFNASDNGPGRSAIFVFALKESTVDMLEAHADSPSAAVRERKGKDHREAFSVPPALQLLQEYFRRAPHDPDVRGRLKVIASCANMDALHLPSFISNYNGKPVLITKSGRLHQGISSSNGEDLLYIEMDICVHRFAYVARKGFRYLQKRFSKMILDIAFLVEGREEDELPEQILGAARLNNVDYEAAVEGDFDGLGGEVPSGGGRDTGAHGERKSGVSR
ncbi:protein of unknown function DUF1336 [Nannochloropsis gaditana]|uniref:Protein ENHANCED DISEASE RESISTANCE 2 C-terminal domain-containing protein n=1 Tax=Nannochloropsis gaditana TaxID=72520 RepID=W7U5D7_9STRA|nr:protein of unknown function DUF1336 [Nannochloropsis gaditana]